MTNKMGGFSHLLVRVHKHPYFKQSLSAYLGTVYGVFDADEQASFYCPETCLLLLKRIYPSTPKLDSLPIDSDLVFAHASLSIMKLKALRWRKLSK